MERGACADEIKRAEGSVQDIDEIPDDLRELYRTAWELPMRALIDMAADRGPFIDQSQSLNLFMETPDHRQALVDVPLRLEDGPQDHLLPAPRPATRIRQTTTRRRRDAAAEPGSSAPSATDASASKGFTDAEAVACSLENPETCEACQ